ncbi:MAG: GAF domain-containing protein [Chloroflexota bacterium]
MNNKTSMLDKIKNIFSTESNSKTVIAQRVHIIGAAAASSSSLFYFGVYLQTGAWQSLANSIGVAFAFITIAVSYYYLVRGNYRMTEILGLAAVIFAYAPGEIFWAEATIYNFTAGLILLYLVKLVLQVDTKTWLIFNGVFLALIIGANVLEPFERYNINLSPALRIYIPSIAILLSLAIAWQILQTFRIGSIRVRLILSFLAVTLIPLIILAVINNRIFRATLVDNANQSLELVATAIGQSVDEFLIRHLDETISEAQNILFAEFLALPVPLQRQELYLDPVIVQLRNLHGKDISRIRSYAILDNLGNNVVDSIPLNQGDDESDQSYFINANQNGSSTATDVIFIKGNAVENDENVPIIVFSSPISSSDGIFLGVLRVQYFAFAVQDIVYRNNDTAGEESFGVLFQEFDGGYLHIGHGTAPETLYTTLVEFDETVDVPGLETRGEIPSLDGLSSLALGLPELQHNLSLVDEQKFFSATDVATGQRINQVAELRLDQKPNWIIAYFQPQDIFLSVVTQLSALSTALLILISAAVAGIAIFLAGALAQPLTRLTEVAQIVASGDLSVKAEVTSQDEIGVLASTFNSMTEQLDDVISNLEGTIAERTQTLERRASYLEAAADVGRAASEVREMDEMLDTVANLIADRFNFYHVGILLVDARREFAELKATNSEGGWRMIARGHKLKIGEQGIVGSVTISGEARIEQSVAGEDAVHFANPELPFTRSEMALPLTSGGVILGALDVQSTVEQAFAEEDVSILQVLADQVAMAINNNMLLERIQASVLAERRAYGELSGQAWLERLQMKQTLGFTNDGVATSQVTSNLSPEAAEALSSGRSSVSNGNGITVDKQQAAIPIKIHGDIVLGIIETNKPADEGPWTQQEIELLEAIGDQLGAALENARLFEETQLKADRERITTDIANKVWSSTDVNKILQTAVGELGRALNVSQGTIKLRLDEKETIESETSEEIP